MKGNVCMKKIRKPFALALCALGLVSLAGCGITTKANYIVEYNYINPNGNIETKYITADDIFERYLKSNPSSVAEAFYDAMYEIQIRLAFTEEGGAMNEYLNEINRETDIDLIEAQDAADEADTDWEDYLTDTLGYDDPNMDEDEKEAQYWIDQQYVNMLDKVEDEYYDIFSHWQSDEDYYDDDSLYQLQQQYNLIWGENGYINSRIPYHVKHILVQIGSTEDDYTRSEVTSDDVVTLYNVVNALVENDVSNGTTFNSIAQLWSEDTGISSSPNGYVMDISTSFVDEFKLGIYVYETLLDTTDSSSASTVSNEDTKSAYQTRVSNYGNTSSFNIPGYNSDGTYDSGSIADYFSTLGVGFIPYGAVAELYTYRAQEDVNGQTVNDGEAAYYPRNIIFNKYFNRHNIAFITDEDVYYAATESDFADDLGTTIQYSDGNTGYSDIVVDANTGVGSYATSGTTYSGLNTANFNPITINGTTKNVLCDENDNPIMVTLNATSSNGLHFIVVERSGLIETAEEHRWDDVQPREVTLAEYFAPENPLNSNGYTLDENGTRTLDYNTDFPGIDENYDGVVDDNATPKITYVYGDTIMNREGYETLVSSGDNNLKDLYESYQESSGDSTASIKEFVISSWLEDASSATISVTSTNEEVQALIDKYVEQTEVAYEYGVAESLYDSWYSYYNTVFNQEREREKGLIPETCAINFGNSDYYSEGNMCYYSASQDQSSTSSEE